MNGKYISLSCPDHPEGTECAKVGRLIRNTVEIMHDWSTPEGTLRQGFYTLEALHRALASKNN